MLVRDGKYEEVMFAVLLVSRLSRFDSKEMFHAIAGWFDCGGVRNWAQVDVLCGEVLGRYYRNGVIGFDELAPWRDSKLPYKRRAVPVTLVHALEAVDVRAALPFLEPLMTDVDKPVQQGTGWFLREAWKRHPKPVERFLLKWKDTSPRVIYQYATEKMTAEAREQFRKSRTPANGRRR
jgi:3-methyladenine DNA glycosylase AlkD